MQKATKTLGNISSSLSNWVNKLLISSVFTQGVILGFSSGSELSKPSIELYVWISFCTVEGTLSKLGSTVKTKGSPANIEPFSPTMAIIKTTALLSLEFKMPLRYI